MLALMLALLALTAVTTVWPRAASRVVPLSARPWITAHPYATAAVLAGTLLGLSLLAGLPLLPGADEPSDPAAWSPVGQAVLLTLLLGGPAAAAAIRALFMAVRAWAPAWSLRGAVELHRPLPVALALTDTRTAFTPAFRSVQPPRDKHRPDRWLRGSRLYLGLAGGGWYLIGRLAQFRSGSSDPGAWWWTVTWSLLALGTAVWAGRRLRQAHGGLAARRAGAVTDLGHLAAAHGWELTRPALPGLLEALRHEPVLGLVSATGPVLAPVGMRGRVGEREVWLLELRFDEQGPTGVATERIRTSVGVRLPGVWLDQVVVSGREAVPVHRWPTAVQLELEDFNRACFSWGADPRAASAVLHPRVIEKVLRQLPDGASLRWGGSLLVLQWEEVVPARRVEPGIALVLELADLLPSWLLRDRAVDYA